MKWAPQGLERLSTWRDRMGRLPLVAIGGLNPSVSKAFSPMVPTVPPW